MKNDDQISSDAGQTKFSRKKLIVFIVCPLAILASVYRIYTYIRAAQLEARFYTRSSPHYPLIVRSNVVPPQVRSRMLLPATMVGTTGTVGLATARTMKPAGPVGLVGQPSPLRPRIQPGSPLPAKSATAWIRVIPFKDRNYQFGTLAIDLYTGPDPDYESILVQACPRGTNAASYYLTHPQWQSGYVMYPGHSERCDYRIRWRVKKARQEYDVKLSIVRPPLPSGLNAQGWDDRIELTWDHIDWKAEDWPTPPTLTVRRADVDISLGQKFPAANIRWTPIAQLAGDQDRFTDRTAEVGRSYYYQLQVNGVLRAEFWDEGTGVSNSQVAVEAASLPGFTGAPVIALAGPPRPLRVALLTESTTEPIVNATLLEFYRRFNHVPWLELVERNAAPSLLNEKQLEMLQTQRVAEVSAGLKTARSVDVILRLHPRQSGTGMYLDCWLDDLWRGQRERVASVPINNLDASSVADAVKDMLAKKFPHYAQASSAQPIDVCGPIKKIAVIGLLPITAKGPAGENILDVLTTALGRQECLQVVDREEIQRILQEQARDAATDATAALKLGQMVHAQAIVSGFYGMDGSRITLSIRVIEVGSGSVLKVIDLEGNLAELDSLGQQLATAIITASQNNIRGVDDPAIRWLEASVYQRENHGQQPVKTALYVTPENPDFAFQLGQEAQQRGDHAAAAEHFTQGLGYAEKSGDPWRFYVALSAELRATGATADEIAMWQRAVQYGRSQHKNELEAQLHLADACQSAGQPDEARRVLDQIQTPSHAQGRMYEQFGLTNSAVQTYLKAVELSNPHADTTPCYAALIRLLERTPLGQDPGFLQMLATNALAHHPYAQLKLWPRLAAAHVTDTNVLAQVARAALVTGDSTIADPLLEELSRMTSAESARRLASEARGQPPEASPANSTSVKTMTADFGTLTVSGEGVIRRLGDKAAVLWEYRINPCRTRFPSASRQRVTGEVNLEELCASLLLDGRRLLVPGFSDGTLDAVDIQTGHRLWRYSDWFPVSNPLLTNDQLFVANGRNNLIELDRETGAVKGHWPIGAKREATCAADPYLIHLHLWGGFQIELFGIQNAQNHCSPAQSLTLNTLASLFCYWGNGARAIDFESVSTPDRNSEYDSDDPPVSSPASDPYAISMDQRIYRIQRSMKVKPADGSTRPDDEGRYETLVDIGRCGGRERAVPVLLELAVDRAAPLSERSLALHILGELAGQAVLPQVIDLLQHPSPDLRLGVIEIITLTKARRYAERLIPLVRDPDPRVQRAAAQAVAFLLGREARAQLAEMLDNPKDPNRANLALALFMAGDETLKPVVQSAYTDYSWMSTDEDGVRVLIALCKADVPAAWSELRRRMKGCESWEVDVMTARCIGDFAPDPRFLPFLARAMPYDSMTAGGLAGPLLTETSKALGRIGDLAAVPILFGEMRDWPEVPDQFRRNPALESMEDLTGQSFGNFRFLWINWWEQSGAARRPAWATVQTALRALRASYCCSPGLAPPLMAGAAANDVNDMMMGFRQGDPIDFQTSWGWTSIMMAAQHGYMEPLRLLVESGAKVDLQNNAGWTALAIAAEHGQRKAVELLLKAGADPQLAVKTLKEQGDEVTPDMLQFLESSQQTPASAMGKVADQNDEREAGGASRAESLNWAAAEGATKTVEMLVTHGTDINARNEYDATPLHCAAEHGRKETLEWLLNHGAKVNVKSQNGATPLHCAALAHRDLSELLLAHGAEVDARDNDGATPLHWATVKGAAECLLAHGADLNAKATGGNNATPLYTAAYRGNKDVIEVLLAHGAEVDARTSLGETPLMIAADHGHREVVELLLAHKAILNVQDKKGMSPLHWAANNGYKDVVGVLLAHGADADARNKEGKTPLELATNSERSNKETIEILQQHGGK